MFQTEMTNATSMPLPHFSSSRARIQSSHAVRWHVRACPCVFFPQGYASTAIPLVHWALFCGHVSCVFVICTFVHKTQFIIAISYQIAFFSRCFTPQFFADEISELLIFMTYLERGFVPSLFCSILPFVVNFLASICRQQQTAECSFTLPWTLANQQQSQ